MFPLAIATGNTYVLKPTEKAPSASLLLVKYLHEIGLPPGVVNVVNGGRNTVDTILTHPDVNAISFVGSNTAGEYIHDVGSKHGKRVQANLGAKNHATVMLADAEKASTIKALVGAAFGAAGQRCMALSVVIFVGELEESKRWAKELVEEAKKLKVGSGFEEGVDIGEFIVVVIFLGVSVTVSCLLLLIACQCGGVTYLRNRIVNSLHQFNHFP
jgi:malonate-semialdehyde dehydrogenase (acetylating)/methylmalonate-semialdehyde dehydrogenase